MTEPSSTTSTTTHIRTLHYNIESGRYRSNHGSEKLIYRYNTIQYNTIQYNTIQYNTIRVRQIQYNTIQCNQSQVDIEVIIWSEELISRYSCLLMFSVKQLPRIIPYALHLYIPASVLLQLHIQRQKQLIPNQIWIYHIQCKLE